MLKCRKKLGRFKMPTVGQGSGAQTDLEEMRLERKACVESHMLLEVMANVYFWSAC